MARECGVDGDPDTIVAGSGPGRASAAFALGGRPSVPSSDAS